MGKTARLVTVVFGLFAVLGVVTAVIAGVVMSLTDGEERSVFKAVALIAILLAVLTGYIAVAASRKWWPLADLAEADPEA
ncbi:MAG: hypothetical protein ABW033_09925 [Acidimicrobiia bacterium]